MRAAPPGDHHDLALIMCGLSLWRQGPRVVFLGADCPIDTLITTVRTVGPALVLLSAATPTAFGAVRDSLRELGAQVPLYLSGPGASSQLADALGATYAEGDPIDVATELAHTASGTQG